MTLRRALLPVLLSLPLAACPGSDPKQDDTAPVDDTGADDTGTGGTDAAFPLDKARDMEAGWAVANGPSAAIGMLFVVAFSAEEGCPVVVEETDTRYEVEGGCSTPDGLSFEGNFAMTMDEGSGAITTTFTGFSIADNTGTARIEGSSTVNGDVLTTDNFSITATGDAAWTGLDGVKIDYTGVEMDVNMSGEAHSGPMVGQATAAGVGALSWDGTVDFGGEDCSGELVGGSVVLSGSQDVTYTPASDCTTGCVPWSAEDGTTGEVCL